MASSVFSRASMPWLRLRSVLRASCPSDARGMNRHREFGSIGTSFNASNMDSFDDVPSHFNAVPHHPRSRSASAGRDSLRSVSLTTDAATCLALEHRSMVQAVILRMSRLACSASCPSSMPLASLPSRPSSARRPCTRFFSSIISHLSQPPWRFQPGTLSTELVCINSQSTSNGGRILLKPSVGIVPTVLSSNIIDNASRHPLRTCNVGTPTDIPPDLKQHYFGHVACPAVSDSIVCKFRRYVLVLLANPRFPLGNISSKVESR